MRLFIAINFPQNVLRQLYEIRNMLQIGSIRGSFVPKDNFHLTLTFLGEVENPRIYDIEAAMEKLEVSEFNLTVSGLGKFSNSGGDIYWMGVEKSPELINVQKALSKELEVRSFNVEKRKFNPHLTLGRRVVLREDFALDKLKDSLPEIAFNVDTLSLMRSDMRPGGASYTEMFCLYF